MASLLEKLKYVVELDAKGAITGFGSLEAAADKSLKKAESGLDKTAGQMTKFGAIAVGAAGIAAIGLKKAGDAASNLGESINAVTVTFGESADGILKLGENAAESVGLSNAAFNGLAVQFSSFASTIAGDGGDVVQVIDDMTGRAADFASVMNIDVADAAAMFQSGLAGETEPLKKFGLDLSAAAVELYAVESGLIAAGDQMSEAEKVTARYGLLMEQTSKTQGDFANTADSAANAQRVAAAQMEDAMASLGEAVTPILAGIAGAVGSVASAFSAANEATGGWLSTAATFGTIGIGALGALSAISGKLIQMRDSFSAVDAAGKRSLTTMGKVGAGLGVVGAAATLLGVAFAARETQQDRITAASERYTAALQAQAAGEKEALRQQIAADIASSDYLDTLHKVGLNEAQIADVIAGKSVPAYEAVRDRLDELIKLPADVAVRKLTDEFGIGIGQAGQFIDKTEVLTGALSKAEKGLALADATLKAVGESTGDTTTEVEGLDAATSDLSTRLGTATADFREFSGEVDDARDATRDGEISAEDYSDAVSHAGEAARDSAAKTREFRDSVTEADTAYSSLMGKLDAQDAWASAEKAIDNYVTAMGDANVETDEQEALLRDAIRGVADFVKETDTIPTEKKVDIYAALDAGNIAAANAIIDQIAKARNLDIKVKLVSPNGSSLSNATLSQLGVMIPGFAKGTSSAPGGLALVGEQGPELVNLPQGSSVTPAPQTAAMLGGPQTIEVHVHSADERMVIGAIKRYAQNGGKNPWPTR